MTVKEPLHKETLKEKVLGNVAPAIFIMAIGTLGNYGLNFHSDVRRLEGEATDLRREVAYLQSELAGQQVALEHMRAELDDIRRLIAEIDTRTRNIERQQDIVLQTLLRTSSQEETR